MSEDLLRYDLMIEAALRDVVRETMETAARDGLPGDHHFYVTFLTKFPGVVIPDYLHKQYPEEMTIVLQYQFFDLRLEDDAIRVTLSFNNIKENLSVPIDAITTFADPSVNFALQFQNAVDMGGQSCHKDGEESASAAEAGKPDGTGKEKEKEKEEASGKIISLDKFRKK